MIVYYKAVLRGLAKHCEQSMEVPFKDLPESALYMIGPISEAKGKTAKDAPAKPTSPQPTAADATEAAHAS